MMAQLTDWWRGRSQREQILLGIMIALFLLVFGWLAILRPIEAGLQLDAQFLAHVDDGADAEAAREDAADNHIASTLLAREALAGLVVRHRRLVRVVREHLDELNGIRAGMFARARLTDDA